MDQEQLQVLINYRATLSEFLSRGIVQTFAHEAVGEIVADMTIEQEQAIQFELNTITNTIKNEIEARNKRKDKVVVYR